jgi:tetratricopeptide (TPR) repeat protein
MAYQGRGEAHQSQGDYDRAIADLTQAITLKPNFEQAYNNRGVAYFHKQDYAHAISDFNEALLIRPQYATAQLNRGRAYAANGERDKAIADFQKVVELTTDPTLRQQAQDELKTVGAATPTP